MKKILRLGWVTICIIILVVYFACCLTPFINPKHFSFLSLFAIMFPYIFPAAFLCNLSIFFFNKKAAAALLFVVFAAGFKNMSNTIALRPTKWQMQKENGTLRVVTWNVAGFGGDALLNAQLSTPRTGILKTITQFNPDIVCLQEYHETRNGGKAHASVKKELDSLGYIYSYISNDSIITIYKPAVFIQGVAIFSRTPLIDSGRINIVNVGINENLIYADVLFNNRRMRFFTAHLLSFALYTDTTNQHKNIYELTYKRKRSVEYKIRETEVTHANEVAHIRSIIAQSPYPVVYCGDINATPASYTYNTLRGNLRDAFLEKGAGLGGTFYKLGKTLRIDVCLPDKRFKVEQCTVPQLYFSDHFPVVADVAWK